MPIIIDSLLVKLGLQTSEFDKGTTQVQGRLTDTGKKADAASKAVAGFLAVVGGTMAIRRFVEDTILANAQLDRLSQNLHENVSDLSAWSNAAEIAGGSASGLQGSMDMLSRAQTELMVTGQSGLVPYLSMLGLSLASAGGKAKPVSEMLLDLADRFSSMDRTTANNIGRSMGIDQGTMQLLLKGRSEVELLLKRQKEMGAVTKQQAEESSRVRAAMVEARQSFDAFGRSLVSDAIPAIEKIVKIFTKLGDWIRDNSEFVKTFLSMVAGGLALIGASLTPINLTVIAVLALAGAVAALWQDYQVFKRGGESLISWEHWGPGIELAQEGIAKLRDLLRDLTYRLIAAGGYLSAFWSGDFSKARIALDLMMEGAPEEGSAPAAPAAPAASASARDKFIQSASSRLGVPANAIDAHLRSETGATGKSAIGAYNYGNIKAGSAWSGATSARDVLEYGPGGKPFTQAGAKFRAYGSPEEAGADYAALIAKRWPGAVGAKDALSFAAGLRPGMPGGYATDPNYTAKLAGIAGASRFASGAGASSSAANLAPAGSRSVETNIGEVKVYTQATDASGIVSDMGKSMEYLFTSQATAAGF